MPIIPLTPAERARLPERMRYDDCGVRFSRDGFDQHEAVACAIADAREWLAAHAELEGVVSASEKAWGVRV